jgi:hypothetical protein
VDVAGSTLQYLLNHFFRVSLTKSLRILRDFFSCGVAPLYRRSSSIQCDAAAILMEKTMLDGIFIAATALFFMLGILYVRGCERLR